jgi:hypothetical protein
VVVRAYPVDPSTLPSRLFPCLCRNRCNYLPGGQTARHALFHKQFFSERLAQLISDAKNQQITALIVLGFFGTYPSSREVRSSKRYPEELLTVKPGDSREDVLP